MIDIREAIKLTKTSRSTILRNIKNGKLSATKDRNNNWSFEPSELIRVFGEFKKEEETKMQKEDTLYAQDLINTLKEQLQEAKEREKNLISILKEEQQSRKELEIRMLPPVKNRLLKKLFG